jgi:hypothetical protein
MSRTRIMVFAVVGALIGVVPVLPGGHLIVDGGPGCDCGPRAVLLIGVTIHGSYRIWWPMLSAGIGAVVVVHAAWLVTLLLRRESPPADHASAR